MLYLGGSVGYFQGDATKLVDDIGALRPTLFIGVPRVFDRIHGRVISQINEAGGLKKMLFNYAFARKLAMMNKGFSQSKVRVLLLFESTAMSAIRCNFCWLCANMSMS